MKKTLNRKQFLILGVGTAAAGLVGCAGDEGDPMVGTGGSSGTGGSGAGTGGAGSGGAGVGTGGSGSGGRAGTGGSASGGAGTGGGNDATGGSSATGGGNATGGGGGDECSEVTAEDQSTTHQHEVVVPPADVAAGTEKTYTMALAGQGAGHTHMLLVTAANFATLKADGMVTVTSIADSTSHQHDVLVTCA